MKLFLYEFASARTESELPKSIRREGAAMLAALRADARRLPGVEVLELARLPLAAERGLFRDLAAQADYSLILAPEFDDLLVERIEWVEQAGGRTLGCSRAAVTLAGDKWQAWKRWQEAGVPTPASWLPEMPPLATAPWVRKWRHGAGSQGMASVNPGEPLPTGRGWILQEYCSGQPASVSFLCGPEGFLLPLLPGGQRLAEDGSFNYLGGYMPLESGRAARATALAERALRSLAPTGWLGFVGVDLLLNESGSGRRDLVVEVNPRLTTSYVGLRLMTETNLLDLWLRVVQGEGPQPPRWLPGTLEFTPTGSALRSV